MVQADVRSLLNWFTLHYLKRGSHVAVQRGLRRRRNELAPSPGGGPAKETLQKFLRLVCRLPGGTCKWPVARSSWPKVCITPWSFRTVLWRGTGWGVGGSFVHFGHHRRSVIPEHFRCLVRGMEPSGSGGSKCPAAARKLIPPDSNKTVRQQSASAAAGSPCFSGKRSISRYTCCREQPGPLSATRCCSGGCDDLYIF